MNTAYQLHIKTEAATEHNNMENVLARSRVILCSAKGMERVLRTLYLTVHGDIIEHVDRPKEKTSQLEEASAKARQSLEKYWDEITFPVQATASPTGTIQIPQPAAVAAGLRHDEKLVAVMPPCTRDIILQRKPYQQQEGGTMP